jgi:hypothetical protein
VNTRNEILLTCLAVIAGSSGAFLAPTALAACAHSDPWTPNFVDDQVPVWYSRMDGIYDTGIQFADVGNSGDVGFGEWDNERQWLRAAIDIVNTASVGGPKLYLAGTDSYVAPNNYFTMNEGITVLAYDCGFLPGGAVAGSNWSGNKAYAAVRPGGGGSCSQNQANSILWWSDPGQNTEQGWSATLDFVGTLVHEFGHILGLDHTDGSGVCDENVFASTQTTNAVMYPDQGGNVEKDHRRRLRADDIVALRTIWGQPARAATWWRSTTLPPDTNSWTDEGALSPGFFVNTPVTLSGANGPDDGFIIAAMTDDSDEIHYQRGTTIGGGWSDQAPLPLIADNGGRPTSLDRIAVAQGRDLANDELRYMIAWAGQNVRYNDFPDECCETEPTDDSGEEVRIHYRVFSGGAWKAVRSTGPTRYKNVSVGYDPNEDLFLIAWIDTCVVSQNQLTCVTPQDPDEAEVADQFLWVRTVKASLGGGGCIQALSTAGHVFETGDISCTPSAIPNEDTNCVIPVTTTDSSGPRLRYIEGHVGDHDQTICFLRDVDPPTTLSDVSYGAVGTAQSADVLDDLLGTYVTSFSNGDPANDDYARIYTVARDAPSGFVDGQPQNSTGFASGLWPLGIGSLTNGGSTEWRVIGY